MTTKPDRLTMRRYKGERDLSRMWAFGVNRVREYGRQAVVNGAEMFISTNVTVHISGGELRQCVKESD